MTYSFNTHQTLNQITLQDWEYIYEHARKRGLGVNSFAKVAKANDFKDIFFVNGILSIHDSSINLNKIRKCKSNWSFSRLIYWVKTEIFRFDCENGKVKIRDLAKATFEILAFDPTRPKLPCSIEKEKWRNLKSSWEDMPSSLITTAEAFQSISKISLAGTGHLPLKSGKQKH